MTNNNKKMFKVLVPVERNGSTFWVRSGTGFTNKDDSINILLDVLPTNGKLQLRDFDEEDRRGNMARPPRPVSPAAKTDEIPF